MWLHASTYTPKPFFSHFFIALQTTSAGYRDRVKCKTPLFAFSVAARNIRVRLCDILSHISPIQLVLPTVTRNRSENILHGNFWACRVTQQYHYNVIYKLNKDHMRKILLKEFLMAESIISNETLFCLSR